MVRPVDVSGILQAFGQLQQSNMNLALRREREKERERARNSSQLRTLGTVGGAVVGGIYGGPGGAVAGSQIGGAAGGAVSSMQGNERFNTQEVVNAGATGYNVYQQGQAQDKQQAQLEQNRMQSKQLKAYYSRDGATTQQQKFAATIPEDGSQRPVIDLMKDFQAMQNLEGTRQLTPEQFKEITGQDLNPNYIAQQKPDGTVSVTKMDVVKTDLEKYNTNKGVLGKVLSSNYNMIKDDVGTESNAMMSAFKDDYGMIYNEYRKGKLSDEEAEQAVMKLETARDQYIENNPEQKILKNAEEELAILGESFSPGDKVKDYATKSEKIRKSASDQLAAVKILGLAIDSAIASGDDIGPYVELKNQSSWETMTPKEMRGAVEDIRSKKPMRIAVHNEDGSLKEIKTVPQKDLAAELEKTNNEIKNSDSNGYATVHTATSSINTGKSKALKPAEIAKNRSDLISAGVIDGDFKSLGEAIPASSGVVGAPKQRVLGNTPSENAAINKLPWDKEPNNVLRAKMSSIAPRTFVGRGFDSNKIASEIPDYIIKDIARDKLFSDDPNASPEENMQKGRDFLEKAVQTWANRIISDSSPNSKERSAAYTQASNIANRAGFPKLAEHYRDKESQNENLVYNREAKTEKQQKVDRVRLRKIKTKQAAIRDSLSRVNSFANTLDPSFLTYGGGLKNKASVILDKLAAFEGEGLPNWLTRMLDEKFIEKGDDPAGTFAAKRKTWMGGMLEEFNAYRKEITGAQASYREIKFLAEALFNEDLSDSQMRAAIKRYQDSLKRGARILSLLRYEEENGDSGYFNNDGTLTTKGGQKFDTLSGYNTDDPDRGMNQSPQDIDARNRSLSTLGERAAEIRAKQLEKDYPGIKKSQMRTILFNEGYLTIN